MNTRHVPDLIDQQSVVSTSDRFVRAMNNAMLVVTASTEKDRAGCLVGFATQASIEPWRLLVGLSKQNHTTRVAERASHLAVHLVDAADRTTARLFGESTSDEIDKFVRCGWSPGPHDTIVIDGMAALVCRVVDRVDLGDHVGYLLDVAAVRGPDPAAVKTMHLSEALDFSPGHPRTASG